MEFKPKAADQPIPSRIGVAALTRMAYCGTDLSPLWEELVEKTSQPEECAAAIMDMAAIAQLTGNQASGLSLQTAALQEQRLYRLPCAAPVPAGRVLAIAADADIGGNTPLDFLLEGSDVELYTLYHVPGLPLPDALPEHDAAFVIVPGTEDMRDTLAEVERLVADWPRPVLNRPQKIARLDRDRLHEVLSPVPGLSIPVTARISRQRLAAISEGTVRIEDCLEGGRFPIIVRPIVSHAGIGLGRLEQASDIDAYLAQSKEPELFISNYIDYRSDDGLFRKYRVVFVNGVAYPCHMAISDQWKLWYLNADMAENAGKRSEEERFMTHFQDGFLKRHATALSDMTWRIGLDYFAIDCAETPAGELLIFEADNSMIIHNMDSPEIFPYKPRHMERIFGAVADMIKACVVRQPAEAGE